jgi:hypothetical protein
MKDLIHRTSKIEFMIEKSENLEPKIVEKIQHRPLTSHKRTLSSNVTLSEALKIGDRNLNK